MLSAAAQRTASSVLSGKTSETRCRRRRCRYAWLPVFASVCVCVCTHACLLALWPVPATTRGRRMLASRQDALPPAAQHVCASALLLRAAAVAAGGRASAAAVDISLRTRPSLPAHAHVPLSKLPNPPPMPPPRTRCRPGGSGWARAWGWTCTPLHPCLPKRCSLLTGRTKRVGGVGEPMGGCRQPHLCASEPSSCMRQSTTS